MKTVLITGASDGIGLALAKKMLAEGYSVIGTSRSGKIGSITHDNFFVLTLDVTEEESIEKAKEVLLSLFEKIDILVNNAGVGTDLGTTVPQRKTFEQTIDTNITGLVFFAEAVMEMLAEGSQVLNISSKLGSIGLAPHINSTAYRISKAGINMYTHVLAERLRPKKISVVSVHPGWVQTKLATKGAPLNTTTSADGIYEIIIKEKASPSFWNAETGETLPW